MVMSPQRYALNINNWDYILPVNLFSAIIWNIFLYIFIENYAYKSKWARL